MVLGIQTHLPSLSQRSSFATVDLSDEKVRAIAESRMDPRHAHLEALLDQE